MKKNASEMSRKELASFIDYSILKPEFSQEEIIALAKEGVELECSSLCINPGYISLLEPFVEGTTTSICPVCDFPFGTSSTSSRRQQVEDVAQYDCVKEIDIVANYGMIRSGMLSEVTADLVEMMAVCKKYGKELKVILETDALNDVEIVSGCKCCLDAGVDFVKTSTGFLTGYDLVGGTVEVVDLIMKTVNGAAKVKASGCIRTREHFLALIDLGVDRCGLGYKSVRPILEASIDNDNSKEAY